MYIFAINHDVIHNSRYLYSFFFDDTATTEIYTLSLHDSLPISISLRSRYTMESSAVMVCPARVTSGLPRSRSVRSEEHTSELQSQSNLVCRLLLEKKKNKNLHYCLARYFVASHKGSH